MAEVDFKKLLADAGIATTQAELDAQWKADVAATNSPIANDNTYSPFWRTVNAIITAPALWLMDFMADTSLPAAFLKTSSGVFLELLADGVNLSRKQESTTQGAVTFTRADVGVGVTVPLGTVVQTASLNGKVYQLKTTQELSFIAADVTLDVPVQAVEAGAGFNLATGYYNVLPTPVPNIAAVENMAGWLTTPGADVETDEDLRNRVRNQFGTASNYHTDSVYRALISEFNAVAVDAIWFVHDAPRGPGTADAYVLFDFAAPVADYLLDINQHITDAGNHGHGDDLQVWQMPEQTQTLVVDVWHDTDLTAAQITALQTEVTDFVNAAFRENNQYSPTLTYPYTRFSFSKLAQELHRELSGLHSVDFSLDDIVSALWVPRLTSLTVNISITETGT